MSSSTVVQRLWKERAAESPGLPTLERAEEAAETLFGHLVAVDLLDLRLSEDRDVVEVSLACGVEPTETNGAWCAAEGRVVWPPATMRGRGVPGLLRHATWAVPDEAAQRARFGRVLLARAKLASYVAWRAAMPDLAGARWDAAIAALTPGEGLVSAVEAIVLPQDDGADAAATVRRILLEALAATK
jgi:hypothetical protein